MKTCCPDCRTIFRVTSEQLKARAGKVRCGQCRRVFNALDSLLDDAEAIIVAPVLTPTDAPFASETLLHRETPPRTQASLSTPTPRPPNSEEETPPTPTVAMLLRDETDADESEKGAETDVGDEPAPTSYEPLGRSEPFFSAHALERIAERTHPAQHPAQHTIPDRFATSGPSSPAADAPPITADRAATVAEVTEVSAIGDAEHGLRASQNKEVLAYDRWLEGTISQPVPPVAGKALAAPFVIAIILLTLTLVGQAIFHFRGVIALTTPSTRPALAALSAALGTDIPLPRDVELVSIEASDLQSDPGRNKLLTLQATLRNRAGYAQAYPAIELTLTDTADKAIVRRVFTADEYLTPAQLAEKSFAANAAVEVRLWLEANEVDAAGYRLYVFYP
ncbi:MAG: DUF3426 domain-containing protein [Candidatus Accumulibacter meliphilus]|jgi:predicted Zn finger-like uncharacterized protein|uniref:DUF3426 domain-containing protein n=1 Tax=Candidatus Accumulibacter meliphilus TaxID=2211374 RepID=UPI002FC2E04A